MGVRLPTEYQEIEYLRATGSQYINTKVVLGLVETIKVTSIFSVDNAYSRQDNPITWLRRYDDTKKGDDQVDYKFPNVYQGKVEIRGYSISNNNAAQIEYDTKTRMDFDYSPGDQKVYKNGELVFTSSYPKPTTSVSRELWLLRTNRASGYFFHGKLYYFSVEVNDALYEYIPCYRKSDGVIGLFEIHNKQFYTNAGTGNFVAGPDVIDSISPWIESRRREIVAAGAREALPVEYKKVSYLQTHNSAARFKVDKNWSDNESVDFYVKVSYINNNEEYASFAGYHDPGSKYSYELYFNTKTKKYATWTSANRVNIRNVSPANNTTVNELTPINAHVIILNEAPSPHLFMYRPDRYLFSGRIYGAKIENNGILISNLIPCIRKSDNTPGMYDMVQNRFYISETSTPFETP